MEIIRVGVTTQTLLKLQGLINQSIYLRTSSASQYQMSIGEPCTDMSLGMHIAFTTIDSDIREKPSILLNVKNIGDSIAGYDFKGIEDSINEGNLLNQINFGHRNIKTINLHFYHFDGRLYKRPKERRNLFVHACTGITFIFEDGATLLIFPPHQHGSGFYMRFFDKKNYRAYRGEIKSRVNVYNEKLLAIQKDISELLSLSE